jgi:hypothetical protein
VPDHQSQNFVRLIEASKFGGVRHPATEDLRVAFAGHHGLGTGDECGEESVELLDVHRPAPLAAFEEVREAVEFGVGQRAVLGEGSHRY